MFREGQYLEIIKISDHCLATAIVTVKEKTVEIDKKKISTNKWLNMMDWAEIYTILEKAIVRNSKASKEKDKKKSVERKKSTSRLDIVYTFDSPEDPVNITSMPTIKVRVSPARRKSRPTNDKIPKCEKENTEKTVEPTIISYDSPEMKVQRLMEGIESSPEEYVPPELSSQTKASANLKYVPSRKSILKRMRHSRHSNSNEYTPTSSWTINSSNSKNETTYVPNPISSLKQTKYETYEPFGMSNLPLELSEAYVPSSKGSSAGVEEYEPDFATKTMKFDTSYVPSSKKSTEAVDVDNTVKKKVNNNDQDHAKDQKRSTITKKSRIASKSKREL